MESCAKCWKHVPLMNSVQCSRWRFVAGVLALGLTGGLAAAEGLAPGELPGGSEPLRSLSKAVNIWRGSWHSQVMATLKHGHTCLQC